jgi:hypothetical protein
MKIDFSKYNTLFLSGANYTSINNTLKIKDVKKAAVGEFPENFTWFDSLISEVEARKENGSDLREHSFDQFKFGNFYVSSEFFYLKRFGEEEDYAHITIKILLETGFYEFGKLIIDDDKKEIWFNSPNTGFWHEYFFEMGIFHILPDFREVIDLGDFFIEDKTKDLYYIFPTLEDIELDRIPKNIGTVILNHYIPDEEDSAIFFDTIGKRIKIDYLVYKFPIKFCGEKQQRAIEFYINESGKLVFIPFFNNTGEWTSANEPEYDSLVPALFNSVDHSFYDIFEKLITKIYNEKKIVIDENKEKLLNEVRKLFAFVPPTENYVTVKDLENLNLEHNSSEFMYYLSERVVSCNDSKIIIEKKPDIESKLVKNWDYYAVLTKRYSLRKFYKREFPGLESVRIGIKPVNISEIFRDDCPIESISVSYPSMIYFEPDDQKLERVYLDQIDFNKTKKIKEWQIGQDEIMSHYQESIMTIADLKKGLFYIKPRKDKEESIFFNDANFKEMYDLLKDIKG